MKPLSLLCITASVGLMAASSLRAQTADPVANPAPTAATTSNATTAASTETLKASGRRVKPKTLEKYDANKNGVLDPEEKAAMKKDRAAMKAERLKKYDKNGDGKLDETEKADMKAEKKADRKANKGQ